MFIRLWDGDFVATVLIDKFLGLHLDSTGDTNLLPGELAECTNIRITENYNARKREGYTSLFDTLGANIQGLWYGKINNTNRFLFACNGHIYEHNLVLGTNTDLGTLTNAKTFFFSFNDNVYILNGSEYKKWTGTGLIGDVVGYRPLIAIGTPPTGGGTLYEDINVLTGAKHQTFNSTGTATEYTIAEQNVGSIDFVKVNGVTKVLGTDYTQDLVLGKVTFTLSPIVGQDNVDIGWTKGTGQRDLICKNKKTLVFGGQSDSRVHIFGNTDKKNFEYFSALASGLPSAEYFTEFNYNQVGSDEYAITDIVKQYDRAIIFKDKNTWYMYYDAITDVLGNTIANFPVSPLNGEKGCEAFGQAQLILNNPFSVYKGVYEWISTNVRDERNAFYKSERVQLELNILNLTNAITFDYEKEGEYWLCVGSTVYIYSYRYDVWYKFILNDIPTCFIEIEGSIYFGTTSGQIMKFGVYGEQLTDNGNVIDSRIETGFLDFGENSRRKFLNFAWVGLQPESRSVCFVEWQSDYSASSGVDMISYNLMDFSKIDFSDFSFEVNYNPQPFRLKLKAKKFSYFKLVLTNDSSTDAMTILSVNLPALIGGMSK
jgi:hypothetical protein